MIDEHDYNVASRDSANAVTYRKVLFPKKMRVVVSSPITITHSVQEQNLPWGVALH